MSVEGASTTSRGSDQPIKEGFRPIGGAIYGVISFVAVFVITTGYFTYRVYDAVEGDFTLEDVFPTPRFVGFPFYNSHRVDTPVEISSSNGFISETVVDSYFDLFNGFVAVSGLEFNPLVFNAITAGILFCTGYVIASRASSLASPESSAAAGASVAVGYLPLFVLGTFLFSVDDQNIVAGPELGLGLLFFGALFTVGFGGLGGYARGKR